MRESMMARTRKDAPTAVKDAPPLDFEALAGTVIESKMIRAPKLVYNPFTNIVRESYLQDDAGENGVKAVEVPGFQVRALDRRLRAAAEQLANEDIGIRIRFAFTDDEGIEVETARVREVPEDDRPVLVKFLGRPRKTYLTDEQKAEALAHGFVIGEGEKQKVDTSRYLAWVREAEEDDENGDDE
jgi:hypothetical protein